jgi:hypothetical protein
MVKVGRAGSTGKKERRTVNGLLIAAGITLPEC